MLDDRFWTKVAKQPNGCWVWTANKNNKGYGLFRPGGTAPKRLAHRLSYQERFGPIPHGGLILHSCDNPACVNPDHLRVGTHKQNVADMDERGRRVSNGSRGEKNPNTTKTALEIAAIRRDYINGIALDDICTTHGITRAALNDYASGKNWSHTLDGETADLLAKARAARRRNNAKITQQDAETIRSRIAAGETGKDLALEYGLSTATISNIKLRQIWP